MTVGLGEQERDELLRAAVAAPSLHNSQPWKFRFRAWVVEVHRDRAREQPAEDPDGRMLFLALGAAIFNLRVAAARQGLTAVVRSVIDRHRPDLVAELDLSPGGPDVEQLGPLAPYVVRRRTNREPYDERRLPGDVRTLLEFSARLEGAELDWLNQPARLKWLRLATKVESSADATRRMLATFEHDPQLAVLSTRYDGPDEWLRAGQAMQRILLEATGRGVSTSVLNQAIEHEVLRWLINDPLGTWRRPQAVISLGYGPPTPPVPRRPISDVLLD
ncbi:hypothetical protein [Kribbella sp. NPDC050470]|uniref:hypothetical protein n=1 Tax=unclassified Kribbella TaxID=2644121 RepID=UPI00379FA993